MSDPNGTRRPIQFWVSVLAIGGLVAVTMMLLGSTTALALFGTEQRAESDTLNNALLLTLGGLVGLASAVGAWLYSRGAQGEPIPPTQATPTPGPGQTVTTTIHAEGEHNG